MSSWYETDSSFTAWDEIVARRREAKERKENETKGRGGGGITTCIYHIVIPSSFNQTISQLAPWPTIQLAWQIKDICSLFLQTGLYMKHGVQQTRATQMLQSHKVCFPFTATKARRQDLKLQKSKRLDVKYLYLLDQKES